MNTIKRSEIKKVCSKCGAIIRLYAYSIECLRCGYEAEIEDEDVKPARYDYEAGVIIEY